MSGAITAIAISTAATLYMAEEQRKAQSNADERLKQEKIAVSNDMAWQQKKKGISDQNAANAALRLRGNPADNSTASFIPGSTGATPIPGTLGVLGGVGGQQVAQSATKMNSALGL